MNLPVPGIEPATPRMRGVCLSGEFSEMNEPGGGGQQVTVTILAFS